MPRVSREQSERHRQDILAASSRLFRERGIDGTSVADLMGAAGLTHGGFYGHFDSKDALAAQVCAEAFTASARRWRDRRAQAAKEGGGDAAAFRAIVTGYLSERARDQPGTACPATSLAADVVRAEPGSPVKAAFAGGVAELLEVLQDLGDAPDAEANRARALVALSTLVGAQLLARATRGTPMSREFLDAARDALAVD